MNEKQQQLSACQSVQDLLSAYLDGELTSEEQTFVSTHLQSCEDCQAEYQQLLQLKQAFANMPEVSLPEYFAADLHQKLLNVAEAEKQAVAPVIKPKKFWQRSWFPRTVAAAIVLCVGINVVHILYQEDGAGVSQNNLAVANLEESAGEEYQPDTMLRATDGAATEQDEREEESVSEDIVEEYQPKRLTTYQEAAEEQQSNQQVTLASQNGAKQITPADLPDTASIEENTTTEESQTDKDGAEALSEGEPNQEIVGSSYQGGSGGSNSNEGSAGGGSTAEVLPTAQIILSQAESSQVYADCLQFLQSDSGQILADRPEGENWLLRLELQQRDVLQLLDLLTEKYAVVQNETSAIMNLPADQSIQLTIIIQSNS